MYYGRVDVYWPSGPIESYRLNKPSIAIVRSTGNDIVLDTTAISRYHVTLTFQNQAALLEDLESVNGTYVDSVRLEAHEPFSLRGGEEIQIGDIRLIYHPPAGLDTATLTSADTTQRVTLSQATYRVELQGPEMPVAPGAHVQATLKIDNLGDAADVFTVEIDGLPKEWVRVDRTGIEVDPEEHGTTIISFKPLRRSETRPGDYPFTVRVRARSSAAEAVDLPAVLHVLAFSGFGMAMGTAQVKNGDRFTLYLHNQGNALLPVTVQGADSAHTLDIQLPRSQVQLGPGERQTLSGTIRPRHPRLFGPDREQEFALVARAHDPSGFVASVPGLYVDTGLLPSWVPVLIVPLLALIALVAVGALLLLTGGEDEPPAPAVRPVIISLVVPETAAVGEVIEVAWSVTDADQIDLTVDGATGRQPYPIEPGAASFSLFFDQAGRYALTLTAHHDDEVTATTAYVEVRPVVVLDLHVLDGTELVRNVRQDVSVTWNVTGAAPLDDGYNIWLDSSDRDALLLAAPLPLSGQHTFEIVPVEDQAEWLVTLYAGGSDNVTGNVTQKLATVYPVCELSAKQTTVRTGPDERYPALLPPQPAPGSPAGTLSYSPLARDPNGRWLRVSVGVEERLGWVPLSDFKCTNFDPDRLVISTDFPPLSETTTPAADGETGSSGTPVPAAPTPRG